MGDPDDEAAGRRGERQLEGLLGPDGCICEAGRVGRLAQDVGRGEGGMLGGPAAGDDDRLARLEGGADGIGQLGGAPPGTASRSTIRAASAGSAAIMSVM